MARTPSSMKELGTQAPDFELPDVVTGKTVSRRDVAGPKGMLAMFICRHCPFVKHVQDELARIGRDYAGRGIGIVAISSNDVTSHPEDSPTKLAYQAQELKFNFPYLFDESQDVARAYDAQCTPDFFLYDGQGRLVYRGQLDDSRPGNDIPVTGQGSARGPRRGDCRPRDFGGAAPEHRLQHQVEMRSRASSDQTRSAAARFDTSRRSRRRAVASPARGRRLRAGARRVRDRGRRVAAGVGGAARDARRRSTTIRFTPVRRRGVCSCRSIIPSRRDVS